MMFTLFSNDSHSPLRRGLGLSFLFAQLVILTFIVWKYEIETTLHLWELCLVAVSGFLVQLIIPRNARVFFFLILSLGGLVVFTGWFNAVLVIVYGLLIFLTAAYIKSHWLKIGTLLILFGILASLALWEHPWIQDHFSVIAIIGSMFLYRIWIFLYDLKYQKESPGFFQNLTYFFMLPNMAFLLFPAVDYKHFISKQYDEKDLLIFKKGVQWMVLGIFHMVLYRFVYYNLLISTAEATDLLSFTKYATMNYALVLRLSGIFHFATGVLCLFGYNLPATFNNYFLARGFSDLWRRLNIYFKDFMVKVFYYPIYFKLRKFGNVKAMVITIMMLFIISWMFHSLQWFWFKGNFPLKWVDAIYWNTFGILLAINAVYDLKRQRHTKEQSAIMKAAINTAQILATFLGMSILWSLWSANTLPEWLDMVKLAISSPFSQYKTLFAIILIIGLLGSLAFLLVQRFRLGDFFNPHPSSAGASMWSICMLGGLLFLQLPQTSEYLERTTPIKMDGVLKAKLTIADEQQQVEGYYTDILFGNNLTNPLAEMSTAKKQQFRNTEGANIIFDYRDIIMKPNTKFLFKDKEFTINRWSGRDKDYDLIAPPNTIRTLLLGGSFVAGSGVSDNEVFDGILEKRMNETSSNYKYEFLNFGCASYDLVDCIVQFEMEELAKFKPDYVFFISQGKDFFKNSKDIVTCLSKNIPLPFPYLEDIVAKSGIKPGMTEQEMTRILSPYEEEILEKSYTYLFERCKENNITPVWAYWPTVNMRPAYIKEKDKVKAVVKKVGFQILDLESIYNGYEPSSLKVSLNDNHPNAQGHKIAADEFYRIFKEEMILTPKKVLD